MGPRLRGWLDTRGRGSRSREVDTSIVDTLTVDRNIVDTLNVDTGCGHWLAGQPARNRVMDTGLWTLATITGCGHWLWTLAVDTELWTPAVATGGGH